MKHATGRFALAIFLIATACKSADGPPVGALSSGGGRHGGDSRLRPLDETHAPEFRQSFNEARDYDRYVVALSPT